MQSVISATLTAPAIVMNFEVVQTEIIHSKYVNGRPEH